MWNVVRTRYFSCKTSVGNVTTSPPSKRGPAIELHDDEIIINNQILEKRSPRKTSPSVFHVFLGIASFP